MLHALAAFSGFAGFTVLTIFAVAWALGFSGSDIAPHYRRASGNRAFLAALTPLKFLGKCHFLRN
jgi:hypothetical protein